MKINLGTQASGSKAVLDLEVLLRSNMLLQAASGGGKSHAIRLLAEQCCPHVPVGIIDVEGEFATLREKHPFVLIGPGGETPADPRSAALVARKMLELGTSFVADIYELPVSARKEWVREFVAALIAAPKSLWRPFLFIIDEAHLFAPEQGHGRESSVALEAIVDLGSRGRKRGYCLVAATQRIGKLSKDVVAELKNVFVGLAVLDIDRERAAEALGKTRNRVARNDFYDAVKLLKPGEFFGLGQAFASDPTRFRFGAVHTTHPEPGKQQKAAPPPPLSKIKALLPQLKDLPQEAEAEAKTVVQMRERIATLEDKLAAADRESCQRPEDTQPLIDAAVAAAMADVRAKGQAALSRLRVFLGQLTDSLGTLNTATQSASTTLEDLRDVFSSESMSITPESTRRLVSIMAVAPYNERPVQRERRVSATEDEIKLGAGERKVMIAVAQSAKATPEQISVLTGFKRSTRDAYLQRLRTAGCVVRLNDGQHAPTEDGIRWLGNDYVPLPTGRALRDHWLSTLPQGESAVLRTVLQTPGITREAIGEATGFKRSTRDAYIQRLMTRKLVESANGGVVPSRGLR